MSERDNTTQEEVREALRQVYRRLIYGSEPLGAKFYEIWDRNAERLYEDEPRPRDRR